MTINGRFTCNGKAWGFVDLRRHLGDQVMDRLPYAARVLAENVLRHLGQPGFDADALSHLTGPAKTRANAALALRLPRVILPDSSGVPVLMDLAALRSAAARRGVPPASVNSSVQVDLVVDHSLQVDASGMPGADAINLAREFQRNGERYRFLRWAQTAFAGLRVFPPGSGIIHQVHIEQIADVVRSGTIDGQPVAFPDMVIGGDSHTPMVGALGVAGWGVGGIEAETVLLGQPYILPLPEFVGVRLTGRLRPGITVTDLALTATRQLRKAGVVAAFVEYGGPATAEMSVPDRATLSNMAPEYGATTGFWPVDDRTLDYLRMTGRSFEQIALVEAYTRAAGLFRTPDSAEPAYDRLIEIDLGAVERSIAGPSKPYNLGRPSGVEQSLATRMAERNMTPAPGSAGHIAMASITSCTNTANPHAMIRAGLVARAAAARGVAPPSWVKTSLAPGSRAVTRYLEDAGLLAPLEKLGFHVVGYACASCGGKSGPLKDEALEIGQQGNPLVAVLSGNRNFDGRIHPMLDASYLCSPALVVAYALAGRVDLDIDSDPVTRDAMGQPVFLHDLWPDDAVVDALVRKYVTAQAFAAGAPAAQQSWQALQAPDGLLFPWDSASTYIVEPPFFETAGTASSDRIAGARILGLYADGLTTDHISPGGEILPDSSAGKYLMAAGIERKDFNTYVGRRGNHEVMARATYANPRIQNRMVPDREGGWTRLWPGGETVTVHEASLAYRRQGVPMVIVAGQDFGVGSSRDWAAKGPALLGVRAVIARSYERIHRSNLIGLGIVPLLFQPGEGPETLHIDGSETISLQGLDGAVHHGKAALATLHRADGTTASFALHGDLRSRAEAQLLQGQGMFQAALAMVAGQGALEIAHGP